MLVGGCLSDPAEDAFNFNKFELVKELLSKVHRKTKMSTPSLFVQRSAEEKLRLEAFLHPKVIADADGNCVVSAKKMQAIYDELTAVAEGAQEILRISKRIAYSSLMDKSLTIHLLGLTQQAPSLYKKLSQLNIELHMSLPMAGLEYDHLKEFPRVEVLTAGDCLSDEKPWVPCSAVPEMDTGGAALLAVVRPTVLEPCKPRGIAVSPPAPIAQTATPAEVEEEDLYA